jgi:hypothetical protein
MEATPAGWEQESLGGVNQFLLRLMGHPKLSERGELLRWWVRRIAVAFWKVGHRIEPFLVNPIAVPVGSAPRKYQLRDW